MDISTSECLQYNFSTIKAATNDFSEDNKLGKGSFGAVYKVIKIDLCSCIPNIDNVDITSTSTYVII